MSTERTAQPVEPPERDSLPRDVEGFRLTRELGRGGMGIVYEAEELASGRRVALKVLASDLRVSEEAFGRFQQEARLAAAISDPSCVFVYGAHSIEGSPAISMELCGGETLEARLRRPEPIPIETAVRWTMEILDGLEAAHEAGVVHRDVKPSNCFLTSAGRVKIGDFGLARTLERDVGLTQSGTFLGSPLYASPEQVRGRQVDLRSDIYSAAATLYALLTSRPPFTGGGVGEVLARILSEPVVLLRSIRPEIPRALERVILKAMSKESSARYPTFAAFRKALSAFENSAREPARRGLRIAAFVVDGGLIGVLGAALLMGTGLSWIDPERTYMPSSVWYAFGLLVPTMLYFGLLEGLFGATPAKWLFGLRVISVRSGQPSPAAGLARVALFYTPQMLWHIALRLLPPLGEVWGTAIASLTPTLIHLAVMSSARRANGWRGLHELASGTRTVQVHVPFLRARPRTAPAEVQLAPAPASTPQVGIYQIEGLVAETPGGRVLRGRDPDLGRSVWILEREGEPAVDESRRTLERRGRLRWLASHEEGGRTFEVFEDPGGAPLAVLVERSGPLAWPTALRLLRELAEELDDDREDRHELAQVWIDRSWHLRLLDAPLCVSGVASVPGAPSHTERRDSVQLLGTCAGLLLGLSGEGAEDLPTDLPLHAKETLPRLLGRERPLASLRETREALDTLAERPVAVTRSARLTQLALSVAVPAVASVVALLFSMISIVLMRDDLVAMQVLSQIQSEESAARSLENPYEPDPELHRARQILVAGSFRGPLGPALLQKVKGRMEELRTEAWNAFPDPSAEEIAAARTYLSTNAKGWKEGPGPEDWLEIAALIPAAVVTGWGLLATILALFTRGGVSMRMTGIGLRTKRGRPASRARAAWRSLLAWGPIAALLWAARYLTEPAGLAVGGTLLGAAVLLGLGGILFAVFADPPSLQDRLAGTRFAPR